MERPKVYVAGKLTDSPIQYLENCKVMERMAAYLMIKGFDPFCPSLDRLLFMQLQWPEAISEERIKEYSMNWLEQCDAVIVLANWETSKGTIAEIKRAGELNIPVFFSFKALKEHFATIKKLKDVTNGMAPIIDYAAKKMAREIDKKVEDDFRNAQPQFETSWGCV